MSSSGRNFLSLFCGSFMLKEGENIRTFLSKYFTKEGSLVLEKYFSTLFYIPGCSSSVPSRSQHCQVGHPERNHNIQSWTFPGGLLSRIFKECLQMFTKQRSTLYTLQIKNISSGDLKDNNGSEIKQNSNKHLSLSLRSATNELEPISDIIMMSGNLSSKYNPHHKPSTIHTVRPSKLDFLIIQIITWNMGQNLDHECSSSQPFWVVTYQGGSKYKWVIFNFLNIL